MTPPKKKAAKRPAKRKAAKKPAKRPAKKKATKKAAGRRGRKALPKNQVLSFRAQVRFSVPEMKLCRTVAAAKGLGFSTWAREVLLKATKASPASKATKKAAARPAKRAAKKAAKRPVKRKTAKKKAA